MTRDLIFCPNCGYIVEKFPSYRLIGWYRSTYSICPFCHRLEIFRIGKVAPGLTSSFSFIFPPSPKIVNRVVKREKFRKVNVV